MVEVHLATLAAEAREAIDSEDFARAADACRRALLRFPRWVEGYWLLGQILVENGYIAQARSCFEAVASAMPDDARAYEGLAAAAEQQHDLPTAVAGLVRAIEVGESSQGVLDELQQLQEQAGCVYDGTYTTARVAHARLLAGQYEEADAAAERGVQEEPDRLDLLVVQAVARLFSGDRQGSRQGSERLLELSPDCLKALAIMCYLTPGEATVHLAADLDALDPEGQTLVWLRSRMTTLGYEADDLPVAPRLLQWQEADDAGMAQAVRPLDRLIPELEAVWPQWLQEAAREHPSGTAVATDIEIPPPPPGVGDVPITEPETPSFLGDVDILAREFEEAMRPSNAASAQFGEPTGSRREQPVEVAAPIGQDSVGDGLPFAVSAKQAAPEEEAVGVPIVLDGWAAGEVVAEHTDAGLPADLPAAAIADTIVPVEDEFAQWRTSPPSESPADGDVTAPSGSEQVAPQQDAVVPVSGVVYAAGDDESVAPPQTINPSPVGQLDVADTLRVAQQAARDGDYWEAIDRYGQMLDGLRTAPYSRG